MNLFHWASKLLVRFEFLGALVTLMLSEFSSSFVVLGMWLKGWERFGFKTSQSKEIARSTSGSAEAPEKQPPVGQSFYRYWLSTRCHDATLCCLPTEEAWSVFSMPFVFFQCVLLVCLLFVDLFDLFFDCFCLLFVCVLAKQRYGFDMDWATGRACDIDKNSRKLLGFIQQLFCLWLLLLEPLVLICLLAPFAKLCLEKHHQVLGGAISQSMHLQQHPGLCEEPSCCNEQDEVGDLDLTSEPILLEHQFFLNPFCSLTSRINFCVCFGQPTLQQVQLANCETHGKCMRAPPGDERTEVGVEGPPCVLFSSLLDMAWNAGFSFHFLQLFVKASQKV